VEIYCDITTGEQLSAGAIGSTVVSVHPPAASVGGKCAVPVTIIFGRSGAQVRRESSERH